jgi:cytochrome c oxidase subunit 3
MGAINTGVLILSSLTAAWAVRAAQLRQKQLLVGCLIITIVCACGFLVVKYFEYSHKAHIGTLFGTKFRPSETPDGTSLKIHDEGGKETVPEAPASKVLPPPVEVEPAPPIPDGFVPPTASGPLIADEEEPEQGSHYSEKPPPNTAMFFTIYFAMTGLHGIHVAVGILVFIWLLVRAIKGHFTPDYYGPVDYAALYWHLVDLIWIYLFPLLYLIH